MLTKHLQLIHVLCLVYMCIEAQIINSIVDTACDPDRFVILIQSISMFEKFQNMNAGRLLYRTRCHIPISGRKWSWAGA